MKPALFLDRDGVINQEVNYLSKIEEFRFIDGVFETCYEFQKQGFYIFVITNQAGIARGYYNEEEYYTLSNWMLKQFLKRDIRIHKIYHCPHHPEGIVKKYAIECDCRKPNPGMIKQACTEFTVDLSRSILVGDKLTDILAGKAAGVKTNILVRSGHSFSASDEEYADKVVNSIDDVNYV